MNKPLEVVQFRDTRFIKHCIKQGNLNKSITGALQVVKAHETDGYLIQMFYARKRVSRIEFLNGEV